MPIRHMSLLNALPLAAALALTLPAPLMAQGAGAVATLRDAAGNVMGAVRLLPGTAGLAGMIDVKGLTPGDHGMHVHMIGKCDGPDFASAGGHLNPGGKKHGLMNPQGPHDGDLPALTVKADGTGSQSFVLMTSVAALIDSDGAAFVVHEKADDQMTDPSGNSGGRMLCGVLAPNS